MAIITPTALQLRRLADLEAKLATYGYVGERSIDYATNIYTINPPDAGAQAIINAHNWSSSADPTMTLLAGMGITINNDEQLLNAICTVISQKVNQSIVDALTTTITNLQTSVAGKQNTITPFTVTSTFPTAAPADANENVGLLNVLALNQTNVKQNQIATKLNQLITVIAEIMTKQKGQGLQI